MVLPFYPQHTLCTYIFVKITVLKYVCSLLMTSLLAVFTLFLVYMWHVTKPPFHFIKKGTELSVTPIPYCWSDYHYSFSPWVNINFGSFTHNFLDFIPSVTLYKIYSYFCLNDITTRLPQ